MPERDEDEAHLDELLGPAPEPEPEDESEAPADPEAREEPAEEQETPEPEQPEPEPEKPAADGESQPESEIDAETEKKRADGLQRELAKLRQELRTERLKHKQQMQAPAPTSQQSPVEQAPQKPQGIPVVVSEDGHNVYVDPDALGQTVEERARAIVEQAQRPTPEQMAEMQERQVLAEFIAENPQAHEPAIQRARQAEEYIGLLGQRIAMQQGIQYATPADLVTVLRQTGADQEVAQHFPDVAPILDEFVFAAASGQPQWKRSIYQRIAASQASAADSGTETPAPPLRDVSQSPQALARKGGGRTTSPTTEEREFDALEGEFRRDPVMFDEKKYKRMTELGRKLDKPGFMDI